MNKSIKAKIHKKREVFTYAEMWHISNFLFDNGKLIKEGQNLKFMASLVFKAFTFEAYLNHIGPNIFKCWDSLERLGPLEKLQIIAEKLNVAINMGIRPWQTLKCLFKYRNEMAHGKTIIIETEETIPAEHYNHNAPPSLIKTEWEQYCNESNIQKVHKDIELIIIKLHNAGKFDLPPFTQFQSYGVDFIQE